MTNNQLKKEIKEDIKRLKEELKEAIYWEDDERIEELKDCIEVQEEELRNL